MTAPRPPDPGSEQEPSLDRHEEELVVGRRTGEAGSVRAVKRVDVEQVSQDVPRGIEEADVERVPASASGDSGEIEHLPDGSVSIPVFEEELVITKRRVLRERIIVRKRVVVEQQRVEAELRREHVEVSGDLEDDGGLSRR